MSPDPVAAVLTERASLDLRLLSGQSFEQAVRQRMNSRGIGSRAGYAEAIDRDGAELEALVGRLAVPESWLFRYPASFELLVDHLHQRRTEGPVLLLSVACAAGQEAFSMAAAALHAGCDPNTTRILAIDRQMEHIATARSGQLPDLLRREPLPSWAARWFTRHHQCCVIDDALRRMVEFEVGDALTGPLPAQRCAAIFCRNLLIYLCEPARRSLLSRLLAHLEPQGLLFLGHADRSTEAPMPLDRAGPPQSFAFRCEAPMTQSRRAPRAESIASQPPGSVLPPSAAELLSGHGINSAATGRPSGRSAKPEGGGERSTGPDSATQPLHPLRRSPATFTLADAQRLADDGRLDEAAAMLGSIISREGLSGASAEMLGLIALARRELPAARRHFEEAVYLEPRRATSLVHLALLLEGAGERGRAASMRARAKRASTASE
jgi:chemotaxis protein methyltransferase WspC